MPYLVYNKRLSNCGICLLTDRQYSITDLSSVCYPATEYGTVYIPASLNVAEYNLVVTDNSVAISSRTNPSVVSAASFLNEKCKVLIELAEFLYKIRSAYSSQTQSQESIYAEKYAEAVEYLANGSTAGDVTKAFLYIFAESELKSLSMEVVAQSIVTKRNERINVFSLSESVRMRVLSRLRSARNVNDVLKIYDLITL